MDASTISTACCCTPRRPPSRDDAETSKTPAEARAGCCDEPCACGPSCDCPPGGCCAV